MKTFFSDLIPRIQKYSQKLDDISLLINQHWVVLDPLMESKTVYIFKQDGVLLIALNGKISKAKWEYLGHNSLLIDINDESYLFKPNIFDENILALKIDSREEYSILINETKFNEELNSITAINRFLNQKYIINPISDSRLLESNTLNIANDEFIKNRYSLKIGSHEEYLITFNNGNRTKYYYKVSNQKYFIYTENEILFFSDKKTCLDNLI